MSPSASIAADAVVVSTNSMRSRDPTEVIDSNMSFVNALFGELLRADEISGDALRSYYVDYLYAQVMNGGFSQFVYNSRWHEPIVNRIGEGLRLMGATKQLRLFEAGAQFVRRTRNLDVYLESDYFGDNPTRDAFDLVIGADVAKGLRELNATWLRGLPNLVVLPIEDMQLEARRRGAALPDRDTRLAEVRAAESRDLKLMRKLCERAGQTFVGRTAAALRAFDGDEVWAYYFLTDRGPHYMIDLGTKALMFPTDTMKHVDMKHLVVEVDVKPD